MKIVELGERFVVQEELVANTDMRLCLARDTETKRSVIMREVIRHDGDEGFPERMQKEADALEDIKSPLIPKLVGVFQDGDAYYVVRNYPGGVSLAAYREKNETAAINQAERWITEFIDELEQLHMRETPYVIGQFGPDDFLVSPSGSLLFLPVSQDTIRPADLMADIIGEHDKEEEHKGTPAIVDVHSTIRLCWWLLTGELPQIGRPQPPLKSSAFDNITSAWLRGLQRAVDPIYPQPPQTMGELRALLLGESGAVAGVKMTPPKLEYEVSSLKFLNGPSGRVVQGTLHVTNVGGGSLRGYSRSTQRWARVVPNTFEGNDTYLQFWIDPTGMRASEEHHANIYLVTQNQEVNIPVEVKTAPHIFSRLPDLFAVIAMVIPGLLLALFIFTALYLAQSGALACLRAALTEGLPLYANDVCDTLSQQALDLKIAPTDPSLTNAKVTIAVTLAAFMACPLLVHTISKHFELAQAKRLAVVEFLAMISVGLWFIPNWQSPTLNPVCAQHHSFAMLGIKSFFVQYVILALGWTLALCYPIQVFIKDTGEKKAASIKKAIVMAMAIVSLAIIGSALAG